MAGSTSAHVIDVGDAEFGQQVIEESRRRPVVVDFWAPWCGPCRALGPVLEKLAAERGGEFLLAKVNTDEAPETAARYYIQSIPAVKAFRDGEVVLEFVGALPEAHLRAFLDRVIPSDADKAVVAAAAAEESAPSKAEADYRQVLAKEPDHPAATVGLARLLVARGDTDAARELLTPLAVGGELGAEVDRLNAVLDVRESAAGLGDEAALREQVSREPKAFGPRFELGKALAVAGKYPEALAELLAAAELDRKRAADDVRPVMVNVFRALGVRHPLSDEYRGKLSQLLY